MCMDHARKLREDPTLVVAPLELVESIDNG